MTAQQLKNSILQMAVSGKLVPQDPNDEPASVLLERIRKEKEQLIKEGKIKKEKNPSYIFRGADNTPYEKVGKDEPVSIADEIPFEIPESWEWVRASSLGQMVRGKGIKRSETVPDGMPCVRYGEIYTSYNVSFTKTKSFIPQTLYDQCNIFRNGDLIFTLTGENKPDIAKTVAYLGESPVAAGGDLAYWTHHNMNPLYLVYYMASPYSIEQKRRLATGDIIVHISTDKVGSFLIPVPPRTEQDRIVAKLQEIEPLLQEYDQKETKVRSEHMQFPEQLKKSILQLAVQGKLVPQDPSDEPASVLLDRIRTEKKRLIAEGKIKRDKNESVIFRRDNSHYEKRVNSETCIDDGIPFDIPDSWSWCRLKSICFDMRYGTAKKSTKTGQVAVLRMGNIQHGEIDYSNLVYSNDDTDNINLLLQEKDILFNRTNSRELVGKTGIYRGDIPAIFAGYLVLIRPIIIDPEYLNYVMNSHYEWSYCQNVRSDGINQSNVSASKIGEFLIPVPPLSEQKRIVNKLIDVLPLIQQNMRKFSL